MRARVYDVSSGVPVLLTTVVLDEIENGYYFGNFTGISGKIYLVVSTVFTDGTFTTLDPDRAPEADIFKSADAPAIFSAFNYGSFNQLTDLFVAANIYDVLTGTPVLDSQVEMLHVYAGVYFGAFEGVLNHVYQAVKLVYTDDTFTTVETDFPLGSDSFQMFQPSVTVNNFREAILVGQKKNAFLIDQEFRAILTGEVQNAQLIAPEEDAILIGEDENAILSG